MRNHYPSLLLLRAFMRFSVTQLLLTSLLMSVTYAHDVLGQDVLEQQVRLKASNTSLKKTLETIESISNVRFIFNPKEIGVNRIVAVEGRSTTLKVALNDLLLPLHIAYEATGRQIALFKQTSTQESTLSPVAPPAQPVTGTVTDETGADLPGVSILIKGSSRGTTTDDKGNYRLNEVDPKTVLVFSYVGYEAKEVPVGTQTVISVRLKTDDKSLSEVVVVGYGTQRQANLTGSVTTISQKQINNRPLTNLASGLSGVTPGVIVNQSSGQPGNEDVSLRVLGVGTLNNANPLVLVDGVEAPISNINPNDVGSITVLKDAAASAIYGSRAANGVVLVTTKKGQVGKPRFTYNAYYGQTSPTHLVDMITFTPTIMELTNEARANVGSPLLYPTALIQNWKDSAAVSPIRYPTTDWLKEMFSKGHIQEHNIGVNGGSENLLYNFSLDYLSNKGIVPTTASQRLSVRANLDGSVGKRFKFGNNLSVIPEYVTGPLPTGVTNQSNNLDDFYNYIGSPDTYTKAPDGRYGGPQDGITATSNNGYAYLETRTNKQNRLNVLNVGYLQFEFVSGLTFKTTAGVRYAQNYATSFQTQVDFWNFRTNQITQPITPAGASASSGFQRNYQFTWFNTLTYVRSFAQQHNVTVLVGNSREFYTEENFSAAAGGILTNATPVLNAALNNKTVSGTQQEWAIESYFGRINYDYRGKYLLEANFRADASSRFAPENRWGYFPSFSAGWRVTEEPFAKPLTNVLGNLKLRGSWGQLGNTNINNFYAYQSLYNNNLNYTFGGTLVSGVGATALNNRDIRWETTNVTDLGLDADFLSNRVHLEADYFNRLTKGILYSVNIPDYIGGLSGPFVNLAEVQNKGWSALVSFRQNLGKVRFEIGGNLTRITNAVTKYQGPNVRTGDPFVIQEGFPINSIYGYRAVGIFRSADEVATVPKHYVVPNNPLASTSAGDIRYADVDGDGSITAKDRTVIGNTIPKYTYGFNLSVQAHGFDLSLLFNGVSRVDALQTSNYFQFQPEGASNRRINTRWLDHWTPANPNASMPRVVNPTIYGFNNQISSFWIQNAAYLRLRNVQLTYTVPTALTDRLKMSSLRVYINAQNPLTSTKFGGFDPERPATSTSINFPNVKVYSVGINAAF